MDLKSVIKNYPDFPSKDIIFRDITPILKSPEAFEYAIEQLETLLADVDYDIIIAPESRGFIFATPVGIRQKKGVVLARKKDKLPGKTAFARYFLEYGVDTIYIQKDDILPGQKVVILDDLLATGGTCACITEIVESLGAKVVCAAFLIELEGLPGRNILEEKCCVKSVLKY